MKGEVIGSIPINGSIIINLNIMGMNSMGGPTGPESLEVTKEQVIEAYQKFIDRGVTSPDDLDPADPEVQKANDLFYKWVEQGDTKAGNDHMAKCEFELEKTAFYFDAGFRDPDYLDEVVGWLLQSSTDVEKNPDDPKASSLRNRYAAKMREVHTVLGESAES